MGGALRRNVNPSATSTGLRREPASQPAFWPAARWQSRVDSTATRARDIVVGAALLALLAPAAALIAATIKIDSRGPVFYRSRRVGYRGRHLAMLKFRKMRDDLAESSPLTVPDDVRLTRVGRFLARTRLDELPQLWHVLKGEMSLVGPRPEDPAFVAVYAEEYTQILSVRPGITGLSQLAFANENEVLDPGDTVADYVGRILPQKVALDRVYAAQRSFSGDIRILAWTIPVVLGQEVAVDRESGRLTRRRSRRRRAASAAPNSEAP